MTSRAITDPDVRALAAIAGPLQADYVPKNDPWEGSPFAWIRSVSSRRRGKIGEQLVAGFLASKGFGVDRVRDSQADLLVNGHRVEIKFSTLWEQGTYTFQQIRDQNYEALICLGISPFDAHCWAVDKKTLRRRVIGKLSQHGGAKGIDTAWMSFAPDKPYDWLSDCGGRLRDGVASLGRLLPRS